MFFKPLEEVSFDKSNPFPSSSIFIRMLFPIFSTEISTFLASECLAILFTASRKIRKNSFRLFMFRFCYIDEPYETDATLTITEVGNIAQGVNGKYVKGTLVGQG